MTILNVKPIMTKPKADEYLGTMLGENDWTILVDYDCDVFCSESGELLAKFRKRAIPKEMMSASWDSFSKAATLTGNRGTATGKVDGGSMGQRVKKDGTLSKTMVSIKPAVKSGIIGFFDRNMRFPYCRTTQFTGSKINDWFNCLPIIRKVSDLYRELIPEKWTIQKKWCDETSPDFVIKDSVFTTITVNKDFQTGVHTDKGDLDEGFGNLVVMRKGAYTGGFFVLLRWGVAFDMQNGDVLFTNVHENHGNTPIKKLTPNAERISLVMYYRKNMISCGTIHEEVQIAKNRKSLKGLNKKKENND